MGRTLYELACSIPIHPIPSTFLSDSFIPEAALGSRPESLQRERPDSRLAFRSHLAQIKSQRDPGPTIKNQIDSNEKADRIEPRDRPLRQEEKAPA